MSRFLVGNGDVGGLGRMFVTRVSFCSGMVTSCRMSMEELVRPTVMFFACNMRENARNIFDCEYATLHFLTVDPEEGKVEQISMTC